MMDPPLSIGFSHHVMSSGGHVPEFPAPPGSYYGTPGAMNTFWNVPAPPSSCGPSPLPAAPYGFVSGNWMEERQSWFSPAPPVFREDLDEESSSASVTAGSTIGFENFGDVTDPTAHYHHIDSIGAHAPAGGDTRSLVRSHTMHTSITWPGDQRYMDTARRCSLHEAPYIGAAHYPGYTQESYGTTCEWRIPLQEAPVSRGPEVAAFCDAVRCIRQGFCASDRSSNSGRIWSVAVPFPEDVKDSEVEISIIGGDLHTELHTRQRDSVCVGDLIADVLRQIPDVARPAVTYPSAPLYPPLHASHHLYPVPQRTAGEEAEPGHTCYLSICGLDEYLQPGHSLRSHTTLQRERSIRLRLHVGGDPQPTLARTIEDDETELSLDDDLEHAQYWQELRKRLFGAVAHYEDQVQYFLHNRSAGVGRVLEAVMEICYLLRSVETQEISVAVRSLSVATLQPNWAQSPQMADPVQLALMELSRVVSRLLGIYSRSFHTDFMAEVNSMNCRMERRSAFLSFHLYAAHNLPENWTKSDGVFYVSCSVIYAGRKICPEVKSRNVAASKSFFFRTVWDEMIGFPVPVSSLPYESVLVLRLYAVNPMAPGDSFIAWSCLPLHYNQRIVQGELLLNMISHAEPPPVITPGALDVTLPTLITVQVDFPVSDHIFQRPEPEETLCDTVGDNLALQSLAHRSSVLLLSEVDKQCLWYYRRCPHMPPNILPLILGSAPGWDPPSISAMYRALDDWTFSGPLEALGLLSPCFADERIRAAACRQLERLSCDELLMFLPQLVQAVKFEWRLDSALVRLLLQRSLHSIQVAHRLYWLLTDAATESYFRGLYRRLLDAVLRCAGRALNEQLSRQRRLLKILQDVAEKVKTSMEEKRQSDVPLKR